MYETIKNFSFYRELWAYRAFMVSLILLATCAIMGEVYRATPLGSAVIVCALALFVLSGVCSFFFHRKSENDERYKKVLQAITIDWKIRSWGVLGLLFFDALLLCAYALLIERKFGSDAEFSPLAIFAGIVFFFCIFYHHAEE